MAGEVLLDAGVVNRCRRRVHLDHDPTKVDAPQAPTDPTAELRMADAAAHRAAIGATISARVAGFTEIPAELRAADRERATLDALADGEDYIWNPRLPTDSVGGRQGRVDLLVRCGDGYLPVLVVRHRITDAGSGALTSSLFPPDPRQAVPDPARKSRSQSGDLLRLAHVRRMLLACGYGAQSTLAGVIGLDADVVCWHDLDAPTWPGRRSTLGEYDARFADRLAVATAAASGGEPLAQPSRVVECRHCPWWPTCEQALLGVSDVSLVLRGEDAVALRGAGVRTVRDLAELDPAGEPPAQLVGASLPAAVAMARAWLADLTVVRKVPKLSVPRANVEVDVDMECFSDSGAYLWGCLLSGVDVGVPPGYRSFVTWDPLPTPDEGRSFGEFWQWLSGIRVRAAARGLSFRAYCYNELAENRWLLASADRFGAEPGVPSREQVQAFIDSPSWVDLYRSVSDQLLCARGKGLKVVAPVAGFRWRDPDAGGENSMRWYRAAVGLDGNAPELPQRERLLRYNEDDVLATRALREWMTTGATDLPYIGDL